MSISNNVKKFGPNAFILQFSNDKREKILRVQCPTPLIMYFRDENPRNQQIDKLYFNVAKNFANFPRLTFGIFDISSPEARKVMKSSMLTRCQIRTIPFFIGYLQGSPYASINNINQLSHWTNDFINVIKSMNQSSHHSPMNNIRPESQPPRYHQPEMNNKEPNHLALKQGGVTGMKMPQIQLDNDKHLENPDTVTPYNMPWKEIDYE